MTRGRYPRGPGSVWMAGAGLLAVLLGLAGFGPAAGQPAAVVVRAGLLEEAWDVSWRRARPEEGQAAGALFAVLPGPRWRRLAPGQTVTVRLGSGEGETSVLANIREIAPLADGTASVTLGRTGHPAWAELRGPARGQLVVRQGPYGAMVPAAFLHRRAERPGEGVLVDRQGGPVWMPVRVLARTLSEAVVDGVAPGTVLLPPPPQGGPRRR